MGHFLDNLADDLMDDNINVPTSLVMLLSVGMASFGSYSYVTEEWDDGTENSPQAVTQLHQEIDNVSALFDKREQINAELKPQIEKIDWKMDVLTSERNLDELKNGQWEELSDKDVAFMRAEKAIKSDRHVLTADKNVAQARTAFSSAVKSTSEHLLLNTDISERDYQSLVTEFFAKARTSESMSAISVNAIALRECQAENTSMGEINSCMTDQGDTANELLMPMLSGVFTLFFMGFIGAPLMGAGAKKIDEALDERKQRRQQKKLGN